MKSVTKFSLYVGVALFFTATPLFGAVDSLSVVVPKTAYIQWLANSSDAMTAVNGDGTAAFADYTGGASVLLTKPADKDLYIGVMCNSLAGYRVTLNGGTGATATTARMTMVGATPITYTAAMSKVASTFTAGTTASTSIDLTGAGASADTAHVAEADLPLAANAPNVWKVTLSLPTITGVSSGLIMSGTYSGGITATVALK